MCGICGIVGLADKKLIKQMTDVVYHRGPDDEGYFLDDNVCLGHRRLSIIDLKGGHQPIHNEDESIWVVFNGEIYNYLDLRRYLEERGHRFYTSSDTEVIVHAYEEFGDECVEKLRGMFAFAIWNGGQKKLFAARDRIGIKPFYYTVVGGKFVFGSEIKSILQYEEIKREVDLDSLNNYITFGYVPGPKTIFKHVYKLLPGHTLTFMDNRIRIREYWDIKFQHSSIPNENYYAKQIYRILDECVKSWSMSDVPIGALLSGGIDSSAIVGLMSKNSEDAVKTFSVGFEEGEEFNELEYARIVSDFFGTEHHEILVDFDKYVEFLPKSIWYMDEPVFEQATIPLYYVSELARKHVKVVLTGEGADELFAGYERYWGDYVATRYQKIPAIVRKVSDGIILKASDHLHVSGLVKKGFEAMVIEDEFDRCMRWHTVFTEENKRELYAKKFESKIGNPEEPHETIRRYFTDTTANNILEKILYVDMKVWLPDDLLMKKDKMGMATSIEARVPFLDHNLIEFAATVPSNLKCKGLTTKYIFKKAVSDLLPKVIIKKKKMGFPVPIEPWLRGELGDMASDILLSAEARKRGYFDIGYIQKMLKQHRAGGKDLSKLIWPLITFELWHRIYIDRDLENIVKNC